MGNRIYIISGLPNSDIAPLKELLITGPDDDVIFIPIYRNRETNRVENDNYVYVDTIEDDEYTFKCCNSQCSFGIKADDITDALCLGFNGFILLDVLCQEIGNTLLSGDR